MKPTLIPPPAAPSPSRKDGKLRQSNFELLRIAAMFMIMFHHFAVHGGFSFDRTVLSVPRFYNYFLAMLGKIGVNLFVMISGYFLITDTAEGIRWKKVIKLWGQVFFYSVVLYLVRSCVLNGSLLPNRETLPEFLKYLRPITNAIQWFPAPYLLMYLLHPWLNMFLRSIRKNSYQQLLFLLLVCWCIIPTALNSGFQSNNLLWFITLYMLAGYMRLYGLKEALVRRAGTYAAISLLLGYLLTISIMLLGTRWEYFSGKITRFHGMNMLPQVLSSVFLLQAFANWRIGSRKWINRISSATFGVYLIHDNGLIRPLLWKNLFHVADYQDSLAIIPYSIAVVLTIFACCALVDLLRQLTVERIFMGAVNRYSNHLSNSAERMSSFFKKLLFGEKTADV